MSLTLSGRAKLLHSLALLPVFSVVLLGHGARAHAATGAIAAGAAPMIELAQSVFFLGGVVGFLFLLVSKWLMGGDLQRFANPALGFCIICGLGGFATVIPGWFGFTGALVTL